MDKIDISQFWFWSPFRFPSASASRWFHLQHVFLWVVLHFHFFYFTFTFHCVELFSTFTFNSRFKSTFTFPQVVQEYERAVIFRLGRLLSGGSKGPGGWTFLSYQYHQTPPFSRLIGSIFLSLLLNIWVKKSF